MIFYLKINEENFNTIFHKSPIKRVGYIRFMRNVIISIGNSNEKKFIVSLMKFIHYESPIIRGATVWTLGQLMPRKKLIKLKNKLLKKEKNSYVLFELNMIN